MYKRLYISLIITKLKVINVLIYNKAMHNLYSQNS